MSQIMSQRRVTIPSARRGESSIPSIPSLDDASELFSRLQKLLLEPGALDHYAEMILLPVRLTLFNASTELRPGNNAELDQCLDVLQKVLPNITLSKSTTFFELGTGLARLALLPGSETKFSERKQAETTACPSNSQLAKYIATLRLLALACSTSLSYTFMTKANYLELGFIINSVLQVAVMSRPSQPVYVYRDICSILTCIIAPSHASVTLAETERRQVARLFLPGLTVAFDRMVLGEYFSDAHICYSSLSKNVNVEVLNEAFKFWKPLLLLGFFDDDDPCNKTNTEDPFVDCWNDDKQQRALTIVNNIIRRCTMIIMHQSEHFDNASSESLDGLLHLHTAVLNPSNRVPKLFSSNLDLACEFILCVLSSSTTAHDVAARELLKHSLRSSLVLACASEDENYAVPTTNWLYDRLLTELKKLRKVSFMLEKDFVAAIQYAVECVDILCVAKRFSPLLGMPIKFDAVLRGLITVAALDCRKLNFIEAAATCITDNSSVLLGQHFFALFPVESYLQHAPLGKEGIGLTLITRVGLNISTSELVNCCVQLLPFLEHSVGAEYRPVDVLNVLRCLLQASIARSPEMPASIQASLVDFFIDTFLPALFGSTWWNVSTSLHSYKISRVARMEYGCDSINSVSEAANNGTPKSVGELRECLMMQLLTLDISAIIFKLIAKQICDVHAEEDVDRLYCACLPYVLEKMHDDELFIVHTHAQQTLVNIGTACNCLSLDELLARNMPMLVNIYTMRLRHLELYPKSASVVKTIAFYSGSQVMGFGETIFDTCFWFLVDYCLDVVDRFHERASAPAVMPMVDVLVAVLRRVQQLMLADNSKIHLLHDTATPTSIGDSSSNKNTKPPRFIDVIVRIARRFAFLLPTRINSQPVLYTQLASGLTITFRLLSAYGGQDDILLPLVYQCWMPLAHRIQSYGTKINNSESIDGNINVFRTSFHLLDVVAQVSRDFVAGRFMQQCFPSIVRFLKQPSTLALLPSGKSLSCSTSIYYRLHCEILDALPRLLEHAMCNPDACQEMRLICTMYSTSSDQKLLNDADLVGLQKLAHDLLELVEQKADEWNTHEAKMADVPDFGNTEDDGPSLTAC